MRVKSPAHEPFLEKKKRHLLSQSLYEQIGEEMIARVVGAFYERAFGDPIIGHFFFKKDQDLLVRRQIAFASSMLGAAHVYYDGKPLPQAHQELRIRIPHFRRRQILMAEVMADCQLSDELAQRWLRMEERLMPVVLGAATTP